jgi:hypothetical protein
MKKLKSKEVSAEVKCPACEGTGFPKVKQPVQPGRRIYPAPMREMRGQGTDSAAALLKSIALLAMA